MRNASICGLLLMGVTSPALADTVQQFVDINPGAAASLPEDYTVFDGKFYFGADDGNVGQELWVSDGSEAGTVLLKDINVGNNKSSSPADFAVFDGKLFFSADNGLNGRELWVTDGTEAGTSLFLDINPGTNKDASPAGLTAFNGKLYFSADDGVNGRELWVTDGTPAGTALVEDINPGSASASPSGLTLHQNKLYFRADNGATGAEPWVLEPPASCGYPFDASLAEVQSWSGAFGFQISDLLDISGAGQQTVTFDPDGNPGGYEEMAMSQAAAMLDPQQISGDTGDIVLPATGVVGWQVDVDEVFFPQGPTSLFAQVYVGFYAMNYSTNQGLYVSVGALRHTDGTRFVGIGSSVNNAAAAFETLQIGQDIGETSSVAIAIDRDAMKVYYSVDGQPFMPLQTADPNNPGGTVDLTYDYNAAYGAFLMHGTTSGFDVTGDPMDATQGSLSLVTCAADMGTQFQFPAGAVDIGGGTL